AANNEPSTRMSQASGGTDAKSAQRSDRVPGLPRQAIDIGASMERMARVWGLLVVPEDQELAMTGRRILHSSGAIMAFVVGLVASASGARAQAPPTPIGTSAGDMAGVLDSAAPPLEMFGPGIAPPPTYVPGMGAVPVSNRVEYGLFDTITESLFGDA